MATCIGEKIEVKDSAVLGRAGESEWRDSRPLQAGHLAKLTAAGRAPRCLGRVPTAGGPVIWGRSPGVAAQVSARGPAFCLWPRRLLGRCPAGAAALEPGIS